VENIFEENADTAAGSAAHRQTDQPSRFDDERATALREGLPEGAKLRSLRLESATLGLVGLVDVIEGGPEGACVVDYKKGAARRLDDGTRAAKENDAVQLAAYALLLREHGTAVESAAIYYAEEKRRMPVALTDELFALMRSALAAARATAAAGKMPPPFVNDRRCDFCSAYPVCLPRESAWWAQARERTASEDAQMRFAFPAGELPLEFTGEPPADHDPMPPPRPPREDGEVLVVQRAGTQVGQRGGEFVVTVQGDVVRKLPLHQVRGIYLYGAVQLTAQAVESCLEHGIDVAYFAASGRFLGLLRGLPASGVDARLGQMRLFEQPFFRLKLARECLRAKISNQRTMLMRNGEVPDRKLRLLADARDATADARDLSELLGIEGAAGQPVFRAVRLHAERRGMEVRFPGSQPASSAGSGQCAVVARLLRARQRAGRSMPRGRPRSVLGLPASAAVWAAGAGAGFDGGVSPAGGRLGRDLARESRGNRPGRFHPGGERHVSQRAGAAPVLGSVVPAAGHGS